MSLVHIQVGQFGNQTGANFWKKVIEEHGLNENGTPIGQNALGNVEYLFNSASLENQFRPRSVLVDLESSVLDQIKVSSIGKLFKPQNFISPAPNSNSRGSLNCWSVGHYSDGADLADHALDAIRIEAEASDRLQGFNMVHSICGGTGSGLGTLLISKIREEYPDRTFLTNTLVPSPNFNSNVFETYNSILSFHQLYENTDISLLYDNEAIRHICSKKSMMRSFTLDDQNSLISRCMLGQTASDRFPSQLSMDLRKIATNCIPFPRLHFFLPSISLQNRSLEEILLDINTSYSSESMNFLSSVDIKHGRFISLLAIFRGKELSMKEIIAQMLNFQKRNSYQYFVEFIPHNCVVGVCNVPEKKFSTTATLLGNSTAISSIFHRLVEKCKKSLSRKCFLHHYTSEGMDEMEFTEALCKVDDLKSDYLMYQDATADEECEMDGQANEEELSDGKEISENKNIGDN